MTPQSEVDVQTVVPAWRTDEVRGCVGRRYCMPISKDSSALFVDTCAAVKGQPCGGVELLDQKLGERNPLVCV